MSENHNAANRAEATWAAFKAVLYRDTPGFDPNTQEFQAVCRLFTELTTAHREGFEEGVKAALEAVQEVRETALCNTPGEHSDWRKGRCLGIEEARLFIEEVLRKVSDER